MKVIGLIGVMSWKSNKVYYEIINDNSIEVITPDEDDRNKIHHIIYHELVQGIIKYSSRGIFKNIIKKLNEKGARGAILGCTEIPLLIKSGDVNIEVFDTTRIHAEKAVEMAFK
ncbi:MAG: amino acid racemase [Chlorobi bacterium]|nr:amino acid racemase [Chlorobiota bacterium]